MALSDTDLKKFLKFYPIKGKKWCIENIFMTDGQIRSYASKYYLKSKFKFNKQANYERGKSFRGKKRPEHSKWLSNNHPLKGKHHSKETKKKISLKIKKAINDGRIKTNNFKGHKHSKKSIDQMKKKMIGRKYDKKRTSKILKTKMQRYGKLNFFNNTENNYSRCKRGYYDINGIDMYFRSLWEANYALYLDFLIKNGDIKKWEYEVDTFWFEKIRRGVRSYTPDFKIFKKNDEIEYHEVKGWMDPKSKTKIKRMAKYYNSIKLVVVDEKCYRDIKNKLGKMLNFY